MATKPKAESGKIRTPLDDQLDDSFPASDPPSLTDPSRAILPEGDAADGKAPPPPKPRRAP